MKKIFIGLSLILFLSIVCIYIFIPGNLVISKAVLIKANPDAANRVIIHTDRWQQQFKTKDAKVLLPPNDSNYFTYKNDTFQITVKHHSSVDILIFTSNEKIASHLMVLPATADSVNLYWQCQINSGINPIKKIQRYMQALSIKQNMSAIINRLTDFLQKDENVYGLTIHKTTTADTSLIATKIVLANFPSTTDIYNLVAKLKKQLQKKGAVQTSAPMVNITKVNSNQYNVMVALPTNVKIPNEGSFFFRRMVPGNFLVTEVVGGNYTISRAVENMQLYITDYKKTSMAIPFQSLVTDRSEEPDTSRWITRIYYPINY